MLDEVRLPYFKGYKTIGHVQYNNTSKHFRTVRLFGDKGFVLDMNTVTELQGYANIENCVNNSSWSTYILIFQKKEKEIDTEYIGKINRLAEIKPNCERRTFKRLLTGGSSS